MRCVVRNWKNFFFFPAFLFLAKYICAAPTPSDRELEEQDKKEAEEKNSDKINRNEWRVGISSSSSGGSGSRLFLVACGEE